jgi:hypothetical protein
MKYSLSGFGVVETTLRDANPDGESAAAAPPRQIKSRRFIFLPETFSL